MSFFKIKENGNLKTKTVKPEIIKTYTSIEEIMKDIENIKLSSKEEAKDKMIDMIYKLLILYRGFYLEKYSGEYDPKKGGFEGKVIFKNVSSNVWNTINDEVEQLKEDFSEEELLKKSKKSKKDMYILNFLYGDLDVGLIISLLHERTSFDVEYEIANNCKSEPLDKYNLIAIEKSAKKYLNEKPFIKK